MQSYASQQTNEVHEIIQQPESAIVSYPDSVSFSVKVSDENNISSYQWHAVNNTKNLKQVLDGTTAKTNTLFIPNTKVDYDDIKFYCVITYNNGDILTSEKALLTLDNSTENIKVVYMCDYAIPLYQTLDLSDTGYGTGKITFSDAENIQIENVNLNNYQKIKSFTNLNIVTNVVCNNQLLYYFVNHNETPTMNVNFVGNNTIFNSVLYPEGEDRGYHVIEFFSDSSNGEVISLQINGINGSNVSITGGECFIINNSDITYNNISINLKHLKNNREEAYAAITAYGSSPYRETVTNGITFNKSNITFEGFGQAIYSEKKLFINNTDINVNVTSGTAPKVSKGTLGYIRAEDQVKIYGSTINITSKEYKETSLGEIYAMAGISGGGDNSFVDSNFNIDMQTEPNIRIYNVHGISLHGDAEAAEYYSTFNNCNIDIKLGRDGKEFDCAQGIAINTNTENICLENCNCNIELYARDYTHGILNTNNILIKNCIIDVTNNQTGSSNYGFCAGILCENGIIEIDLNNPENSITSTCNAPEDPFALPIGTAFTENIASTNDELNKIVLKGLANLEDGCYFDLFNVKLPHITIDTDYQTIFSDKDPDNPLRSIKIASKVEPINPDNPNDPSHNIEENIASINTGDNITMQLYLLFILLIIAFFTFCIYKSSKTKI